MSKEEVAGGGGEGFWRWDIPYMVWFRFHNPPKVLAKTGIRSNIWNLGSLRQYGQPEAVFFLLVLIWLWRDRYYDNVLIVIRRVCERQRRNLVKWDWLYYSLWRKLNGGVNGLSKLIYTENFSDALLWLWFQIHTRRPVCTAIPK